MIPKTASSHTERTRVEHRNSKFNVAEMSGTLGHVLAASRALESAVDAAELWVVQTPLAWPLALFVHCLGILDVANTHVFCFLRREETELNLLNRLERRLRVGEARCCRHGCGWIWVPARLALDIIQAVFLFYQVRVGARITRVNCSSSHSRIAALFVLLFRCCLSAPL
jgi:hypothetical protein